jgi:glycyl-tRNA synthetase (class II)
VFVPRERVCQGVPNDDGDVCTGSSAAHARPLSPPRSVCCPFPLLVSSSLLSLGHVRGGSKLSKPLRSSVARFMTTTTNLATNVELKAIKMDDIVNLCKKKGFVFQSSEIYSPMAGFYDYGPLGVELKNNIKKAWWKEMVHKREDIVGLDSSIISSPSIWKASGHVAGFSDPMVDCKESKQRFRADQVYWAAVESAVGETTVYVSVVESEDTEGAAKKEASKKLKAITGQSAFRPFALKDLTEAPSDIYHLIPSPATGQAGHLTPPRDFNLMFQTSVGAMSDASSVAYLRPETAQVDKSTFIYLPM